MKRKWLPLLPALLAVVLLGSCASGSFVLPMSQAFTGKTTEGNSFTEKDTYLLCTEQGDLRLYVNPVTTHFYVENKKDGSKWFSSPENSEEDSFADGMYKMEMASSLIISYVNSQTQENSRFNTNTGSVMDRDFVLRRLENGFRIDYHFAEYQVTVPLCIYLEDNTLKAEVLTKEIKQENADIHIGNISVLPFFGAGENKDQGYLFVADGAGGLIHFNNGKYAASAYNRPVYGREPTAVLEKYDLDLEEQNICLPVFGIQRNGSAFVAVIENGAAQASMKAYTNMQQTSYANIYADFAFRNTLDYSLGNIDAPVYEKGEVTTPSFRVVYSFLAGEDADYNGMARKYKSYLKEKYHFTEAERLEPALYLELYGGVSKTVSRLGFQTEKVISLTNTSQVKTIVDALKEKGVDNIVVNYLNWNDDELAKKSIHSGSIAGSLNKGEYKFKDLLQSEDIAFYPALYNLTTFETSGFFKRTFESATDISGVAVRANRYAPGIGTALKTPYYFITAKNLPAELKKTADAAAGKKISKLSLSDVGNLLYNDYRNGNVKRENVQMLLEQSLAEYDAQFDIMLNHPNSYALPYAHEVFAAPTTSSGQDLLDEEVPFYNMVLSGLKRYSCPALNNSAVGDDGFLKALETGSMAAYTWIYGEASLVKNTELSFLSSSNYRTYIDKAAEQYQTTNAIAQKAGNGSIYSHEKISKGVYCLTYETGAKVYVNYNEMEYILKSGETVEKRSYLLLEGGNRDDTKKDPVV